MLNTLLSRMPMGRRFNVGVALALVPILSLCYWLLAHEWSVYLTAREAQERFATLRATLFAMERVSAERGPTNGVLGEDLPIPAPRAIALARARLETDKSIAHLLATLQTGHCTGCADDFAIVSRLKAKLAAVRRNADRLARLPRTERGDEAVQDTVRQVFAVADDFGPLLVSEAAVVARGDPSTLNCLFIARLTTDLGDQAGRLGSHLTAALEMHRPLTLDEKLAIERTRGRIDQLHAMIDVRMAEPPTFATQAFAALSTQYFGEAERYVEAVEGLADRPGGANLTTAQFAQQYVPRLQPIVGIRDAVLGMTQEELQENRTTALWAVVGTAAAVALLLTVLGLIVLNFRRGVVSPFVQATQAIRAIAGGDLTKEIPASFARGEILEMFDAIRVLKATSVERSRLEAERARLMRELAMMAETDSLTRLFNRRAFEKRARALCAQSQGDAPDIALIMFDIDHFKRINDTYGHAVGDDALRLVARLCRRHFARSEIVARIGGEEFAVMTSVRAPDEACAAAEWMRKDIASALVPLEHDSSCHMTASFGIAFASPNDGPDVAHLLKEADRMLYAAKMAGRNRVMASFGMPGEPRLISPLDERCWNND